MDELNRRILEELAKKEAAGRYTPDLSAVSPYSATPSSFNPENSSSPLSQGGEKPKKKKGNEMWDTILLTVASAMGPLLQGRPDGGRPGPIPTPPHVSAPSLGTAPQATVGSPFARGARFRNELLPYLR